MISSGRGEEEGFREMKTAELTLAALQLLPLAVLPPFTEVQLKSQLNNQFLHKFVSLPSLLFLKLAKYWGVAMRARER